VDGPESIGSIRLNGTQLEIGIEPGMNSLGKDCMLLESTQLLDEQEIEYLRTTQLTVGTPVNGMLALAETQNVTRIEKNVVRYFVFDLAKIETNSSKHYYVIALHSSRMVSIKNIDKYLFK
jgi:hypothetical protein